MYNQQFVLAVLNNGSPVREINGKVTLPFGSEYKIRLKNKNTVRANARVYIDGRKVSGLGDFILHAGETLDLERFLDESMAEGNRFKFVPLSDSRVNDPTDSNNGIIKVEFYLEEVFKIDWNIPIYPIYPPKPVYPISPTPYPNPGYRGTGTFTVSNSAVGDVSNFNINHVSANVDTGQAGATVEGGQSNQKFVEGDYFNTSTLPTTLTLKIQGPREHAVSPRPNPRPQRRFCSSCGSGRRKSDKFCSGCGARFPTKRRR